MVSAMVSLNSCRRQLLFFVLYLLCICNAFIRIGSLKHSNSNSYNSFRVTVNNNQHKDSNSEQKYVNNNNIVTDRHDGLQNLQSFTTRTIAKTIQKILVPIVIGTIPILHSASITNAASEIGTKPIAKAEKDTYSILEDPFFEKSIFNLPPGLTPYPSWLAGTWSVNYKFVGAQFTEQFPYRTLASNVNVPGFRKYSVAYLPDIGKETTAKLRFVNGGDGIISEDRVFNLKSIFQSFMNDVHAVVDTTSYDSETNANRCSLAYHDDKGSGKIELFSNSRTWRSKDTDGTFQTAENIRQSSVRRVGVDQRASQSIGDYALYWTLRPPTADSKTVSGSFTILSYLQPQDDAYFLRPKKPVGAFQYKVSFTPDM